MARPIVYELNTRSWLQGLRPEAPLRLQEVPESEFLRWRDLGFTHLWLMGIWSRGAQSRQAFLAHARTAPQLDETLPGWKAEDVVGSAYAVAAYRVPEMMGGDEGLARFRAKLHEHDLRLIVDFVPNHVGLDHPWLRAHPEYFVEGVPGQPGSFAVDTPGGRRWLAHGKDPWFPAWTDTAQLDHRLAQTRTAVLEEMRSVTARSDGVRCDMAMLLLREVFSRNWAASPGKEREATGEFWAETIAAASRPGFIFLAEAYWDLEEKLQELGFDYVYDKRVTDFVVQHDARGLRALLESRRAGFLERAVHFLENHDEPRVAARLGLAEHRAAALLILGLPGLALLHDGQLEGARQRASVHLARRAAEPCVPEILSMYQELLTALRGSLVGVGRGQLLRIRSEKGGEAATETSVVVAWSSDTGELDLVVVNLGPHAGRGRLALPGAGPGRQGWEAWDRLAPPPSYRPFNSSTWPEVELELPAYGAQLLHCRPVSPAPKPNP